MKYIHLNCLKEWLESKKETKKTPHVNSYIWKNLECEICKHAYSDSICLENGIEVSLLDYKIHEDARVYVILESVSAHQHKTIHILNFTNKNRFKVGRCGSAHMKIIDLSVSRIHSIIRLN